MFLLQNESLTHMPVIGALFPGLEKVIFHPDTMPFAGCVAVAVIMLVCVVRWIMHGNLLRRAAAADSKFTEAFRHSAHALALFQQGDSTAGSARSALYTNACRELAFHLLGSDAADKNFATRLRTAGRITPSQWEATQRAAWRSLDESARWLRAGLGGWGAKSLLALGFLGSLLSLMEHAAAGALDLFTLASCLRPLALALLCHIIGMAWHRRLMRDADEAEAGLKDFSTELGTLFERSFVDHRQPIETLPSLQGMGMTDAPTFSVAPTESARAGAK
jgi:hypothetical protein